MVRIELTVDEINRRKSMAKGLAELTFKEVLNVLPNVLLGPLGIIIPSVGNIYFNFKENQKEEERKNEIERLTNEFSKKVTDDNRQMVLEEIEKACMQYITNIMKSAYMASEIYTVDVITITLRSEEYIRGCLETIETLLSCPEAQTFMHVDNVFSINESITLNLLKYYRKYEIEDLLDELTDAIDNTYETYRNESIIKVIHFD